MSTSKKTPAQLNREVAEVLAARAVERRSPTTASGVVKKLLSKARRLISDQRTDDLKLRDPGRSLARLSDIATEAIDVAEGTLAVARLPSGYEEIWATRFADAAGSARSRIDDLRALQADPAGVARSSRLRWGPGMSPELATALYYGAALDDLVHALRRTESMAAIT